ncbi:MAG: D-alanine--D-alanine ligase [Desulfobulbaceae bacterium]|nr:D-alanine--D-alanine ligase [Desulfobulbaceae bacterium]
MKTPTANNQPLRVALLAGGKSGEREVSLAGAREVAKALDPKKYVVKRYDPSTDMARLAAEACDLDVVFILLHGRFGEDGTVQGFLDLLGLPYQGSGVLGSALAMDKDVAKTLYRVHGLPVSKWRMAKIGDANSPERLLTDLNLPLVVKPVRQGSSLGMSIAHSPAELGAAISKAFDYDQEVMVEEYVKGREITVGVIGNKQLTALPLVEIIPGQEHPFFDYQAKYQAGASKEICPADLPEAISRQAQEYALTAHRALKLQGYSRTDMIVTDTGLVVLETNTIPGMTPTSLLPQAAAAAGLPFPALLDRLLELALSKQQSGA